MQRQNEETARSQDSSILSRFTIPLAQVVTQSSPSNCATLEFLQVSPGNFSAPPFWSHKLPKLGESNGTPLQYSCPENPTDGGAWWAAVHEVAKSWTRLSDFTFTHWRRKWQTTPVFLPGEPQGQGSLMGCRMELHRVGHDWSDLAAAAAACTPYNLSDTLKVVTNCVLKGWMTPKFLVWTERKATP